VVVLVPAAESGIKVSMQPVPWPDPDPVVVAAVRSIYGSRKAVPPLAVAVRDRLGEWLHDEPFASAFGTRGRPGWSPSRLALVTVLQRAEDLTDRMAAEAVRARLDWKYLLGLPLDDPGFDHSVLAEFRARVAEAGLDRAALDALLGRLEADGLVRAGGRQRTDSSAQMPPSGRDSVNSSPSADAARAASGSRNRVTEATSRCSASRLAASSRPKL
jgi:transposase